MTIAGRTVGQDAPCYIVAELSSNHLGDLGRARRIVEAAAEAGADAVKLQTYTPETITLDLDRAPFLIPRGNTWAGRTLAELYAEAMTPWEWHGELFELAASLGLHGFSSPFDVTAVAFLEKLGVPAYKVASFEIVDLPLIRCVAATGKPMILSTGMAGREEIAEALAAFRGAGGEEVVLLKCTSAYPAPPEAMNLATLADMAAVFGVPVGLSDHSPGVAAAVAAVALGACVVEKHLTLSRAEGGPDAGFSLEPGEFARLVEEIRQAEVAVGEVSYELSEAEIANRIFRRSLFFVRDLEAGAVIGPDDVRSIRPAAGLHPRYLEEIIGRRTARAVRCGTPVSFELLAGS